MIYKYKGYEGRVSINDNSEAFEILIYNELNDFESSFKVGLIGSKSLNYIINKIKKEINLFVKRDIRLLIEENQGNIQL